MYLSRIKPSAAVATCLLIATFTAAAANAGERAGSDQTACRQEVWRVSVVQNGGNPKNLQLPRYQKRTVLVCDQEVFAEIQRRASSDARTEEAR